MRVSDSSVEGGAGQFHTTRWTLVIASVRDQSEAGRGRLPASVRPIDIPYTPLLAGADIRRQLPKT